jgi:tectonic-1/3
VNTEHGCDGIIASLKIKIAFAFVGPVNYPQAKIIGVLYEFGDSFNIPRKLHCNKDKDCLAYNHKVTVSTTVVFLDATQSPTLRIGQWPVVSIKLPQDFFYPFSTTSVGTSTCSRVSVLFVLDFVLIAVLQKIV